MNYEQPTTGNNNARTLQHVGKENARIAQALSDQACDSSGAAQSRFDQQGNRREVGRKAAHAPRAYATAR